MALTEDEKSAVLQHLGYAAGVEHSLISSGPIFAVLSYRTNLQASLERVTSYGETQIRDLLGYLDSIEAKLRSAQTRLAASAIGTIRTNHDEPGDLEHEFRRWALRLAELLGCSPNPLSARFSGSGANVPRRG